MKKLILGLVIIFLTNFPLFSQISCFDHQGSKNNNFNWYSNGQATISVSTDNANANISKHLQFGDGSGASVVVNAKDYTGNWIEKYTNKCLTLDFKINFNGGGDRFAPKIMLYKGNIQASSGNNWINNVELLATFIANDAVSSTDAWKNYEIPFGLCTTGGVLPNNQYGKWVITKQPNQNECENWNTLIQSVTGIVLPTDYHDSPSEIVMFDNFCFKDCNTITMPVEVGQCDCIPSMLYNEAVTYSLFRIENVSGDILNGTYKIKFQNNVFSQFTQQNLAWNSWINAKYGFTGGLTHSVVHQFMLYEILPNGQAQQKGNPYWIDSPNYNNPSIFNETLDYNKNYVSTPPTTPL
jgi:hypothetical protein